MKYRAINVVWEKRRVDSTIHPLRALLTMLADLIMLRLLTLGRKHVALQKLAVGNVIGLSSIHRVGARIHNRNKSFRAKEIPPHYSPKALCNRSVLEEVIP